MRVQRITMKDRPEWCPESDWARFVAMCDMHRLLHRDPLWKRVLFVPLLRRWL